VTGYTDDSQRALIQVMIQAAPKEPARQVVAWIDTAFDGHFVCSNELIRELGLKSVGKIEAILADGSVIEPELYLAYLDWHGAKTLIQVIANDIKLPLLGTQLLKDCVLLVNYKTNHVEISR
jgi:clan AA aspartic protease